MWDAQLLRSILLELGLSKENPIEKQRTKFQKIIALRKFLLFMMISEGYSKGSDQDTGFTGGIHVLVIRNDSFPIAVIPMIDVILVYDKRSVKLIEIVIIIHFNNFL